MKFLLKILFAPVIVILTLIIWTFALILRLSAWVFGIIGTIFGILGLAILLLDSVTNGIIVLVIAFLVSPVICFSLAKKRAKQGQCRRELRLTSLPANISA